MIILSEHDAARLGLNGAKKHTTRGRKTRPDLPAAGQAPRTGLSTFIAPKAGSGKPAWSLAYTVASGYRLYVINTPLDTGFLPSERAACDAAKELSH